MLKAEPATSRAAPPFAPREKSSALVNSRLTVVNAPYVGVTSERGRRAEDDWN